MKKIVCNNFAGIRRISPCFSNQCISAYDMQNVELFKTGINSGIGIRTQKGNISVSQNLIPKDENIVNIFESIQNNTSYFIVHTSTTTQGKLYILNINDNELILKADNLSPSDYSVGIDFAQGNRELFIFTNGIDKLKYIEIGAEKEYAEIDAIDREGRNIIGKGLAIYQGRLWTFYNNRLHYSVVLNIDDWATSDIEVETSAGFIEFPKKITAIYPYISGLAVFFNDSSVIVSQNYPFIVSQEAPGGCFSQNTIISHGTDLYFYDDTKKGIYSFQQIVLGNKTLGNNIALEIQEELKDIDTNKLNELKAISVNIKNHNEIWFLLPIIDNKNIILIFDYLTGEWIKRISQKLNCLAIFQNELYSASGNQVLKEYKGNDFNGKFIEAFYRTSPYNANAFNKIKAIFSSPRIALDIANNNFWIKYIKNMDSLKYSKTYPINAKYKNYMMWNINNWCEKYWYRAASVYSICKIPKTSMFKVLEILFFTTKKGEEFSIKNLELNNIYMIDT